MITRSEITRREKFEIESGTHRSSSLIITLCGEFEYTVGRETKRVLPYNPVIFKKGVSFIKKVISPIEFIIISSPDFLCNGDTMLCYEEEDIIRLNSSVEHLKDAIISNKPDSIKEHFANDILLTAKSDRTKSRDNSLLPAYEYICQNFNKNISLSFLADLSSCSIQTLINKFKKNYGKTPVKCIVDFRINKAKELLMNTDFSVSQISEICGYDNVYYFSNVFKKETGLSPLKYRQSYML